MNDRKEIEAFWALRRSVGNNGIGDEPVGGVIVAISWNAQTEMFEADLDGGSMCSVAAPTLVQALLALEYLDEGEAVVLDAGGRALCLDCGGSGCAECGQTGRDPSPPHAWPGDGVVV